MDCIMKIRLVNQEGHIEFVITIWLVNQDEIWLIQLYPGVMDEL